MLDLLPILLAVLAVLVVLIGGWYFMVAAPNSAKKKPAQGKVKDRATVLREATRKLASNPKDPDALMALADIYFNDNDFDKASKTYSILSAMTTSNPDLDAYLINLRSGLCALKLGQTEEAYKSLLVAKAVRGEAFEVNYNLGVIEYQKKAYEKAVSALRGAVAVAGDHPGTLKYLGQSLYRLKSYKDAAGYLRKAMDAEPNDKECLFFLAQTYYELGQAENAVQIFTHLRPDPEVGPQAALFAGTIHYNARQFDKAIEDLEIGVRHQKVAPEVILEMKYRLANAYTQAQNMEAALRQYKDIRNLNPNYRDVADQIRRLSEFHSNKNLQIYMMAPTSEFVTLCRTLTGTFFPKASIKVVDVTVEKNDYADITCEVSTSKWDDTIVFRFLRSSGMVGELFLRDMQVRLKEMHAGRGFCITAGTFTPTAKQFVEARLIDLIEKDALLKAMASLN
ncbi:MAG TPA: tetratricopeptide repeat protein [Spirochaetia bacterium]|nr:tetratricopeptide repeat protein [Spirochaetia bacterium]